MSEQAKRKPGRPKKDNASIPAAKDPDINNPVKRKRGRPKGSGGNKRPDRSEQAAPGENNKFLSHDMKIYSLPKIDINNPDSVQSRIKEYFAICTEDDIKPTVESLALAFSVSRFTLFDYINGRNHTIKNPESILTLKTAYDIINSYYAHMMNNGKINPVAGIFLMKNNYGYKDTTDYVINANTDNNIGLPDITTRAGLLDE